jgi:tetratricopeptide (TPR) repeat protein
MLLAPAAPEMPPAERKVARKPVSPAAAVLREDFARHQPSPEPEPEPQPVPSRDEFEDEYLCPYCAAPTRPDDRECRGCGNKLWVRFRRREERSSWLWVAMTLQAAGVIWPAAVALLMLMFAAYQAGLDNFFRLVPVYLGLANDVPPEMAAAALEWLPRLYVLPFFIFSSLSLAVLVGLYARWKPIFYLFLASAVLTSVFAFAGIAVALGLPREGVVRAGLACSGGGVILALLMFLLLLQIQDDFFFDEKRLLLRPDRDATNGPALLNSGQRYARRNMWALAAIHLRRAVSQIPHEHALDCHLALSMAYLNLKRYVWAASALEEARRIDPGDPRVQYLTDVLASRQTIGLSSR